MRKIVLLFGLVISFFIISCDNDDLEVPEEFNSTQLTKQEFIALVKNGFAPSGLMVPKINRNVAGINMSGIVIDDQFIPSKVVSQWVRESLLNFDQFSIKSNRIEIKDKEVRTISVNIITQGPDGLTENEAAAIITALKRYNALNLKRMKFKWFLDFNPKEGLVKPKDLIEKDLLGLSEQALRETNDKLIDALATFNQTVDSRRKDVRIVSNMLLSSTAVSSIAFNGNPGNLILIDPSAQNLSQNELVLLMQHEIGHVLGLGHTDFVTRSSCGAIGFKPTQLKKIMSFLPNKNTGTSTNSIMTTCLDFSNDNLKQEDVTVLKRMYSRSF